MSQSVIRLAGAINSIVFFAKSDVPGHNDHIFYFSFTFYQCTFLMRTIIISKCLLYLVYMLLASYVEIFVLFSYAICVCPKNLFENSYVLF